MATMAFCCCKEQNVPNALKPSDNVNTGEVISVYSTSATILSTVNISTATEVGIVYATESHILTNGGGNSCKGEFIDGSTFSTELTNLSEEQTYYYCAYIKVDGKKEFGIVKNFSTKGNYAFSVSDGKYVKFSKGNLQYQPSTDKWRFAEHQYDVYGRSAEDNVGSSGWIDLFAWGTGDDPMFVGNYNYKTYFTDWGNNYIGNDSPYTWRTLTSDEWEYLLSGRLNSQALWGLAKVNNIEGLIILPDNFESPKGIAFNSGNKDGYQTNVYTPTEWEKMEKAGTTFLPTNDGYGYYWSSTAASSQSNAYNLRFNDDDLYPQDDLSRCNGFSVRPVPDL